MFIKSVTVVLLCILIAWYLHEYHIHTINQISRAFPSLDSTVGSVHVIFKWFENYVRNNGKPIKNVDNEENEKLFTVDDLKRYKDKETGLYLAILGKVYDVSKGSKYYGPGESYHFFTGCDGSRAFVTGDFTESGLTDHVLDLSSQELKSLFDWAKFYRKEYIYKGKLVGRFYDSTGWPTEYYHAVKKLLAKAIEEKANTEQERLMFPPCNVEWTIDTGSRVWCTKLSGGIKRDWIGVPRKLYEPGSETFRCACVNLESNNSYMKGNLREYPECNPKASSCHVYS